MKKYTVFLQYLVLPVFLWSSTLIALAQVGSTPAELKTGASALNLERDYYFPANSRFSAAVPTPSQFFKRQIGHSHTRYDQILNYFQVLAKSLIRLFSL